MNTNVILSSMEYWSNYDDSMRMVCTCPVNGEIKVWPVGEIVENGDRWGVDSIVLAEGGDEPTVGDFVDICSQYDHIRVLGQAESVLLPVAHVFVSGTEADTLDGELGESVVVFELD